MEGLDTQMVLSINSGPQYRQQNTIHPMIGRPKVAPTILGHPKT